MKMSFKSLSTYLKLLLGSTQIKNREEEERLAGGMGYHLGFWFILGLSYLFNASHQLKIGQQTMILKTRTSPSQFENHLRIGEPERRILRSGSNS